MAPRPLLTLGRRLGCARLVRVAVGLYPGSFDPVHLGHLTVIDTGAQFLDELVVAVVTNPAETAVFPADVRVELLRASTRRWANVRCVAYDGLVVDAARREGAAVIVRSAGKEWHPELSMAAHNKRLSGLETVMIPAGPATRWLSSSVVRSLAREGRHGELLDLVPPAVAERLGETFPAPADHRPLPT